MGHSGWQRQRGSSGRRGNQTLSFPEALSESHWSLISPFPDFTCCKCFCPKLPPRNWPKRGSAAAQPWCSATQTLRAQLAHTAPAGHWGPDVPTQDNWAGGRAWNDPVNDPEGSRSGEKGAERSSELPAASWGGDVDGEMPGVRWQDTWAWFQAHQGGYSGLWEVFSERTVNPGTGCPIPLSSSKTLSMVLSPEIPIFYFCFAIPWNS